MTEREGMDGLEPCTKMQKLRGLSIKAKQKARKVLHVDSTENGHMSEESDAPSILERDPAFNPGMLNQQKSANTDMSVTKACDTLRSVAAAVVHPKDSLKNKATKATASKLSKTQRPYLSQEADLDFLNTHDELNRAQSTRLSMQGTSDGEMDSLTNDRKSKVAEMEEHRESLRVAWITSRHVNRVRVIPKRHVEFPSPKIFETGDNQGRPERFEMLNWLGHILLFYTQDFSSHYVDDFDELPFDIDSLRHHIERLVMASAPWQSWAMDVRSIYRWDSPGTTLKWLAIYIFLWYIEFLMGFFWLYIIYFVIKNRFFPTSVGSLRESMQRTFDSQNAAYKFGEMIDKHGQDSWIEPLIDELGPYIQLQLGDIANMLEVFHKLSPRKTAASLAFIASCLLISVFTDMSFCMRIAGFISGGTFFLCWPIASLYPKYRYLVSPFKWILWDIPTHAEWSFQYLRRQAQITREQMIQKVVVQDIRDGTACPFNETCKGRMIPRAAVLDSNTDDDDDEDWHSAISFTNTHNDSDIISFRAYSQGLVGRLIVQSGSIRFVQSMNKKELWKRTFLELVEMSKVEESLVSRITTKKSEQLELRFNDGNLILLKKMKDRDEAFNTIIGFSSLQWQALQTDPSKVSKGINRDKRETNLK
ncbi:hypothetical protein MMC07_009786 [Pseudocyphellaria aurata]|nr:hypothetical protein [Pseudocyphellaria aurata]